MCNRPGFAGRKISCITNNKNDFVFFYISRFRGNKSLCDEVPIVSNFWVIFWQILTAFRRAGSPVFGGLIFRGKIRRIFNDFIILNKLQKNLTITISNKNIYLLVFWYNLLLYCRSTPKNPFRTMLYVSLNLRT